MLLFKSKESAQEKFQAEIFKGRLGLAEGDIVRPVSPELARTEVAELVRTLCHVIQREYVNCIQVLTLVIGEF